MVELSNKRVEEILHKETLKTEALTTILRGIYTRYMRLYEKYFADIDALSDDEIDKMRNFHEVTKSLIKHYYMDIPLDICTELNEFDNRYSAKLLGHDWHEYLFDKYRDFKDKNMSGDKSEKCLKAEFSKQTLAAFYDVMDSVFREGFGTGSQTAEKIVGGLASLLFGQ